MLNYVYNFFKNILIGRSLSDRLNEIKKIKICGVIFHIKKFNALDYLDGSKVMKIAFDLYKIHDKDVDQNSKNKIKLHYRDVFMAGVVKPKLSRNQNDEGVFVDEILEDMELANRLYSEIYDYTYGKKKLKLRP